MKKILFTGGGSAGHVVPNIALIERILADGKAEICYIGTDGIEKNIVAPWRIPYFEIECPKLVRGGGFDGFKRNLTIPKAFFRAVKRAEQGLREFCPDAVFSKGGYVALPVVFAAKKLKIPCYAHESDYSLGLANRLSAPLCKKVFTSFPETAKRLKRGEYCGAPMREELFRIDRSEARDKLGIPEEKRVLLVFGGGSGSRAINEALRANLNALLPRYTVLHVCGKSNAVHSTLQGYRQIEYATNMGELYAAADIVLSRAGAGTVFELIALKKPAVLVPLEGQTRGDQKQNAEYFAKRGLCQILPQSRLHELPSAIDNAVCDEKMRIRLSQNAYTSGNERILRELLK